MYANAVRPLSLLCGLALGACTLGVSPEPETAPAPPMATQAEVDRLAQEVAELRAYLVAVDMELSLLKPLGSQMALLEQQVKTFVSQKKPVLKKSKPAKQLQALDLVVEAQKAARVEITPVNFHGGSAELAYVWQPGQVYPVHLSWNAPTLIALPPGAQTLVGFNLDPEQYQVITERAGQEPLTQDVISIKPKFEKGEIDTFLVTNQGYRILFHFIVGAKGALSVTFETPRVHTVAQREQKLVLPKPVP